MPRPASSSRQNEAKAAAVARAKAVAPSVPARLGSTPPTKFRSILEEETEQFVQAEKTLSQKDQLYMRKVFSRCKRTEKAAAKIEKKIALAPI